MTLQVVLGPVVQIKGPMPSTAPAFIEGAGAFAKDDSYWCAAKDWQQVERRLKAMGIAMSVEGIPFDSRTANLPPRAANFDLSKNGGIMAYGNGVKRPAPEWLGQQRDNCYANITPYAVRDAMEAYRKDGIKADLSPDAEAIVRLLEEQTKATDDVLRSKTLPDVPLKSGKLMEFQRRNILFGLKAKGRFFVADSPGLGKTWTAIGFARQVKAQRILVVCPAVAKGNWRDEIAALDGRPSSILGGRYTGATLRTDAAWFIINPDILAAPKGSKAGWVDILLAWQPDIIILDEAHYFKGHDSQRSLAAKQLARQVPMMVCLSGTPITATSMDLWNPLDMLQKGWWGNWFSFGIAFAAGEYNRWSGFWQFKGSSRQDILHKRLKSVMIRHRKEDVLPDLPKKSRSLYPVEMDAAHLADYKKMWLEWKELAKKHRAGTIKAAEKGRLLSLDMKMRQCSSEGRIKDTIDLAEQFIVEGKAPVVFAYFTKSVHAIADGLRARGHKVGVIDGNVSTQSTEGKDSKRDQVRKDFLEGRLDCLVGQIEAAGQAISLHTRSDLTITHDFTWLPHLHLQSEDRVNRVSSVGDKTTHVYMVADDTVEMGVMRNMLRKLADQTAILDTGEAFMQVVLSELEAEFFDAK